MFENFSRRNALDKPQYELKHEYVPPAFRMDVYKAVTDRLQERRNNVSIGEYVLYTHAAVSVNRMPAVKLYTVDDIESEWNSIILIELMMDLEWHEVLSVIEFLVNNDYIGPKTVNRLFEYHNLGYRLDDEGQWSDKKRVVVYYQGLIEDTNELLQQDIPFRPVIESIEAAKRYLVDPNNIDIANSIKSSVSAVEGYLKGYLQQTNGKAPATMEDCIKELKTQKLIPDNILESLKQLYIYRNRTENVGHGAATFGALSTEDALLCNEMAVSFLNYLHRKLGV